jgi:hypothetical protein
MARLQNGSVIEGNILSDWGARGSIPKLDNQALLDPANPFRWLIDRSLVPPTPPAAFIEFATGDRLPGTVQGFRNGNESLYAPQSPHLLVNYLGTNPTNLDTQTITLRIDLRGIRRIVWRPSDVPTREPATAVLVTGSVVRFRSVRFSSSGVTLLTASGIRRIPYVDLAELQMPTVDFWPVAFDELALLSPSGQSRLIQIDTRDGLIATTSLDRYLSRVVGDHRDVNRWIHGIQPAWSLDVIWVPQGTVWARRSFSTQEMPLFRVPATRFEQRSTIGDLRFPYAVNRNVLGGPQRCVNREVGWGLGVHAFAQIEYEFPPEAQSLRSEFAIDAAMSDGGCVMPRIVNLATGDKLYEGPVIVGSSNVVDSGRLTLSAAADEPRRIALQVDPVLDNRPPGADPFDVRDNANWIEPLVEFEPARLQRQLDERILRILPGWREWTAVIEPGSQAAWSSFFAEGPGSSGEFAPALSVQNGALKLALNRSLTHADRWLVVDAVRTQSAGAAIKIAIQMNDQKPTEHELPTYDKSRTDFRPIVVPLTVDTNAAPVTFEIRQIPAENASAFWRSVTVSDQHPMLFQMFEDQVPSWAKSAGPSTVASNLELDDQQKHFGTRSLVVTKDKPVEITVNNPLIVRERPQLGEYRLLRFAVRKQGGGAVRLQLKNSVDDRTVTFETGPKPTTDVATRYLTNAPLKDEWQVFTRDLYGELGNIDIASLKFEILDGTKAWLDHIYFARTQSDFDLIKN